MKRPSSQSNTSNAKMSKTSHSREVSVRSTTDKLKYIPPPSLTAKQLKAFQFLVCGSCYVTILEGGQMNKAGLRVKYSKTYHGDEDDNDRLGVAHNFLEGKGRFDVLWDNGRIAQGYGHLTGLRRDSIDMSIRNATLRGDHLLSGRQIMEKAKEVICESKKFLAYWKEFLNDGKMPSGMNEDDAIKHVMKRAQEETSCEIEPDNESGGTYLTLLHSFKILYDCL